MVTLFIFGKDISQEKVELEVLQPDGSLKLMQKPFFDAIEATMDCGIAAAPHRVIFGEKPVTVLAKASIENWRRFCSFVE